MADYVYSIQNDFPNHKAVPDLLTLQIPAAGISTALTAITILGDVITFTFESSLSGGEVTILNAVVAVHTGVYASYQFLVGNKLNEETEITTDAAWTKLSGSFLDVTQFCSVADAVVRIVGEVKTSGTGAELRLVEDPDGSPVTLGLYSVPDTSDVWMKFSFLTTVAPQAGEWLRNFQGRRNGATSLWIRYVSLALLRKTML